MSNGNEIVRCRVHLGDHQKNFGFGCLDVGSTTLGAADRTVVRMERRHVAALNDACPGAVSVMAKPGPKSKAKAKVVEPKLEGSKAEASA